ncbi:Hypothetical protein NTJ_10429 [Nesidiocoris tenuis]|uniref:Uncharacterized protein n=1 Tax=Nesidiocoris tenuis TaxID=355587 RepID=A0ABN7AZM2_9HEMI|nr:Hypothetical protein NTJ_10429 [Nesidiocoris tenuis]
MGEVKSIQEPKDIFCSVYRKNFIFWEDYERRRKAEYEDAYKLTPEAEAQFLGRESGLDIRKMETYLEQMKELNRIRLRTLYSIEYPKKSSYKTLRSPDREQFSPKNDKFLTENSIKFGPRKSKVLAPLPTARRILGYSSYDDYRTPLSVYEDVHARFGYDRVKLAADSGFWRMGPKFDVAKEFEEIERIIRRGTDALNGEKEHTSVKE